MAVLIGKFLINGEIKTKTGLHIGGSSTGLEIGGVDQVVIRDTITNRPYIPGSSLKGSLRSLLERAEGKTPNKPVGRARIHVCEKYQEYSACNVCRIFGVPAESINDAKDNTTLTRLIVRDSHMTDDSAQQLENASTDLPYTDVKTEVVIDRITSAANPRQIERVPAGIIFEFEMIFNVFEETDKDCLKSLFEAMVLLEDDHLGGQGSRGYGKVEFINISLQWRPRDYYLTGDEGNIVKPGGSNVVPKQIATNFELIMSAISNPKAS